MMTLSSSHMDAHEGLAGVAFRWPGYLNSWCCAWTRLTQTSVFNAVLLDAAHTPHLTDVCTFLWFLSLKAKQTGSDQQQKETQHIGDRCQLLKLISTFR